MIAGEVRSEIFHSNETRRMHFLQVFPCGFRYMMYLQMISLDQGNGY